MRNMGERSELYEVLAILEMSSISKEKEEKSSKKTGQPITTDHNDDEDDHNHDYNDNDHSNKCSKNDDSHRSNNNDTVKPPLIRSMSASVLAYKSSFLPVKSNDSSVDAIGGEEQELSFHFDEAVGNPGPSG